MSWPRLALMLAGLGFAGFGVAYAVWPLPMGRLTDIPLPTATARIDFAAIYGGVQLGFGIFLLVASKRREWLEPGLWAGCAVFAALVLVRLLGILVTEGSPGKVITIAIGIELAGLLTCLHALRYYRHARSAA
jgi:hypothetical protein